MLVAVAQHAALFSSRYPPLCRPHTSSLRRFRSPSRWSLKRTLLSAFILQQGMTGGSVPLQGVVRTRSLNGQSYTKAYDNQTGIAATLEPSEHPSSLASSLRSLSRFTSLSSDDASGGSGSDAETDEETAEWLVFGWDDEENEARNGHEAMCSQAWEGDIKEVLKTQGKASRSLHRGQSSNSGNQLETATAKDGHLCTENLPSVSAGAIRASSSSESKLSPVQERPREGVLNKVPLGGAERVVNGATSSRVAGGGEDMDSSDTDVVSVTTWNVLAPIYKRVGSEEKRESDEREVWLDRNRRILDVLLEKRSSIICLQEFWLKNEELWDMYKRKLGEAGYDLFTLGRTHDKGDGLLTAIANDRLRVLDRRDIIFHDCGDRVAQLLHLQAAELLETCNVDSPHSKEQEQWCGGDHPAELILVNTHLMFPHNANACIIRLRQTYKLVDYLGRYQKERNLPPMAIILCGDWNGNKHGQVYKFLRSRGFVSSYDVVRGYGDEDPSTWISHRNHRGNLAGVDFVWLLNPSALAKPLEADWKTAAYSMIRAKLSEAGLKEREAFKFFSGSHKDYITLRGFQRALGELGLAAGSSSFGLGLSNREMEELAAAVDADKDGMITYEDAKAKVDFLWPSRSANKAPAPTSKRDDDIPGVEVIDACPVSERRESELGPEGLEFNVRSAAFDPPDMEEGKWPEDYVLSDHAPLTCVFAPIRRADVEENVN